MQHRSDFAHQPQQPVFAAATQDSATGGAPEQPQQHHRSKASSPKFTNSFSSASVSPHPPHTGSGAGETTTTNDSMTANAVTPGTGTGGTVGERQQSSSSSGSFCRNSTLGTQSAPSTAPAVSGGGTAAPMSSSSWPQQQHQQSATAAHTPPPASNLNSIQSPSHHQATGAATGTSGVGGANREDILAGRVISLTNENERLRMELSQAQSQQQQHQFHHGNTSSYPSYANSHTTQQPYSSSSGGPNPSLPYASASLSVGGHSTPTGNAANSNVGGVNATMQTSGDQVPQQQLPPPPPPFHAHTASMMAGNRHQPSWMQRQNSNTNMSLQQQQQQWDNVNATANTSHLDPNTSPAGGDTSSNFPPPQDLQKQYNTLFAEFRRVQNLCSEMQVGLSTEQRENQLLHQQVESLRAQALESTPSSASPRNGEDLSSQQQQQQQQQQQRASVGKAVSKAGSFRKEEGKQNTNGENPTTAAALNMAPSSLDSKGGGRMTKKAAEKLAEEKRTEAYYRGLETLIEKQKKEIDSYKGIKPEMCPAAVQVGGKLTSIACQTEPQEGGALASPSGSEKSKSCGAGGGVASSNTSSPMHSPSRHNLQHPSQSGRSVPSNMMTMDSLPPAAASSTVNNNGEYDRVFSTCASALCSSKPIRIRLVEAAPMNRSCVTPDTPESSVPLYLPSGGGGPGGVARANSTSNVWAGGGVPSSSPSVFVGTGSGSFNKGLMAQVQAAGGAAPLQPPLSTHSNPADQVPNANVSVSSIPSVASLPPAYANPPTPNMSGSFHRGILAAYSKQQQQQGPASSSTPKHASALAHTQLPPPLQPPRTAAAPPSSSSQLPQGEMVDNGKDATRNNNNNGTGGDEGEENTSSSAVIGTSIGRWCDEPFEILEGTGEPMLRRQLSVQSMNSSQAASSPNHHHSNYNRGYSHPNNDNKHYGQGGGGGKGGAGDWRGQSSWQQQQQQQQQQQRSGGRNSSWRNNTKSQATAAGADQDGESRKTREEQEQEQERSPHYRNLRQYDEKSPSPAAQQQQQNPTASQNYAHTSHHHPSTTTTKHKENDVADGGAYEENINKSTSSEGQREGFGMNRQYSKGGGGGGGRNYKQKGNSSWKEKQ